MFTGIVEEIGEVKKVTPSGGNKDFVIGASLASKLKIDQSLAHNGVCLTVVDASDDEYTVTAVRETLQKSNLGELKVGDKVNLERSVSTQSLLDGHIVQGHVDQKGNCESREDQDGSTVFTFTYAEAPGCHIVEKGSVTVNGVSLTAFDVSSDSFAVAIIPYTLNHTNFNFLKEGDSVNLEFDIIGKYVERIGNFKKSR